MVGAGDDDATGKLDQKHENNDEKQDKEEPFGSIASNRENKQADKLESKTLTDYFKSTADNPEPK